MSGPISVSLVGSSWSNSRAEGDGVGQPANGEDAVAGDVMVAEGDGEGQQAKGEDAADGDVMVVAEGDGEGQRAKGEDAEANEEVVVPAQAVKVT